MTSRRKPPMESARTSASVAVRDGFQGSEAELLAAALDGGRRRVLLLRPGFRRDSWGEGIWLGWLGRVEGGVWRGTAQVAFRPHETPIRHPVDVAFLEASVRPLGALRERIEEMRRLVSEDGITVVRSDAYSSQTLDELGGELFRCHRVLHRRDVRISLLSETVSLGSPARVDLVPDDDTDSQECWLVCSDSEVPLTAVGEAVAARRHLGAHDQDSRQTLAYTRWVETAAALQRAEADLADIHRSRMWKLWMLYLSVRYGGRFRSGEDAGTSFAGVLAMLLVLPAVVLRGLGAVARTGARQVRRGLVLGFRLGAAVMRRLGAAVGASLLLLRSSMLWAGSILRRRGAALRREGCTGEPTATTRPRVLIVSPYSMYPPDHGGGARLYNLVRLLSHRCDLYLVIYSQRGEDVVQRDALEEYAREVHFHPWVPRYDWGLLALQPPNAQLFATARVHLTIRDLVERHGIDVVQLEYTELAQYLDSAGPAKTILTEHDLAYRQHLRRKRLGFDRKFPGGNAFGSKWTDLLRLFPYEILWSRRADLVHTMSAVDGEALGRFMPDGTDRIRVAPNAVATADFARKGEERPDSVLFVGNFQNLPNLDALEFLLRDVWPLVREVHPTAHLTVVGPHLPEDHMVHGHLDEGITVAGRVDDIRDAYHSHQVLVAPLRAGSGTRLKIVEAFAAGTPVVSTRIGCEGLDVVDGQHLVIADAPGEMAEGILRLLRDDAARAEMAEAAATLARESYDWQRTADVLMDSYRELMAARPTTAEPTELRTLQDPAEPDDDPVASVILPTLDGGEELERVLERIFEQEAPFDFEVVCIDSESGPEHLERMQRFPIRLFQIPRSSFNHGLTRDQGARLSRGRVLVFLNQDALPENDQWLRSIVSPLLSSDEDLVAVQGGMREVDELSDRFYWDSCGHRFYFTSESREWLQDYGDLGFSTVNAAIRRSAWERVPFGWAPTMEDKKWQREVVERNWRIDRRDDAMVVHTHDYDLRSLRARCRSEGEGWRLLGYRYGAGRALRDVARPGIWKDLAAGIARRRVRSVAELFFPVLRPLHLWRGNRGPLGRQPS